MDAVKTRRAGGTECLDALYMLLNLRRFLVFEK